MTFGMLASLIAAAIVVQVAVLLGVALLRRTGAAPVPAAKAQATTSGAWDGFAEMVVLKKVFEDPSRSVCSFHLAFPDRRPLPAFKPGQFLTFRLETGAPAPLMRCYSLSDRPGLDHYRISVKRAQAPADRPDLPPGLSSAHLHDRVHEGERLWVKAPAGHFVLEPGDHPVVLIAGGIGLTPVLSMVNHTLAAGSTREIWLFLGLRNSAEHPMKSHLEALARQHANFRLVVCYSRPLAKDVPGVDFRHSGHVDLDLLRRNLSLKPYRFYICGSAALMDTLVPALAAWGVPEENVHFEAFGPSSPKKKTAAPSPAAAALEPSVTFAIAERTLVWNPESASLLEFAEDNGIGINSGCRAGGCGACQTVIRSGEVMYDKAPDFEPAPGSCLMCVSRPSRDLVLEA